MVTDGTSVQIRADQVRSHSRWCNEADPKIRFKCVTEGLGSVKSDPLKEWKSTATGKQTSEPQAKHMLGTSHLCAERVDRTYVHKGRVNG